MVNGSDIIGIADVGGGVGVVAGKGGGAIGSFLSDISVYVSNMGLVEWVLLLIVGVGGFVVWHLKNKHDLKFSWSPKRPKKTFN